MIRPKNETEDLLISITKYCKILVKHTHRKPEETLEVKVIKPREAFHFNPPIHIKGYWMLGSTDLEVHKSLLNVTKEKNKFELFTDTFDEFPFGELKDEVEELLSTPNITDDHLENETKGPRIIKTYWELRSEKSSTDGYIILLMGYARSLFRDFEMYLRIVVGLDEDDISLILKQYNANFVTFDLDPANYTFEDFHEAVCLLGDHKGTLQVEYDGLDKKTKHIFNSFW